MRQESGMKARNAYRKLVNVKLAHQQLFEQLERQSLLPKETNTWNLSDCEECVFAGQTYRRCFAVMIVNL